MSKIELERGARKKKGDALEEKIISYGKLARKRYLLGPHFEK